MESYDHAYYLDRLEAELASARIADNILVAAIHMELAKQYQIHLDQNEMPRLRIVASN